MGQGIIELPTRRSCFFNARSWNFIFCIILAFLCSLILVTIKLAFIYFVPDIQIKFKSHCGHMQEGRVGQGQEQGQVQGQGEDGVNVWHVPGHSRKGCR